MEDLHTEVEGRQRDQLVEVISISSVDTIKKI